MFIINWNKIKPTRKILFWFFFRGKKRYTRTESVHCKFFSFDIIYKTELYISNGSGIYRLGMVSCRFGVYFIKSLIRLAAQTPHHAIAMALYGATDRAYRRAHTLRYKSWAIFRKYELRSNHFINPCGHQISIILHYRKLVLIFCYYFFRKNVPKCQIESIDVKVIANFGYWNNCDRFFLRCYHL